MKKRTLLIVFTFFIVLSNAQTTSSNTSDKLHIDATKSELKWIGEYAFYFGGHNGVIDFMEGYFVKNYDVITGGEFVIDMKSIKSLDIESQEGRESLDNHLKNEDFFDVKKFPTAKLVITKVSYHDSTSMKIYANLTIKDVTLPINFQAEVDYDKQEMTTRFKIDRTLWGITYNSKEVEGKLKDGLISDAVGFEVKLSL